jgi:hypothetical protein
VTQKFEELHLSITPIKHEKYHYLVRTEESPKGVLPAEEQVILPVEDWLTQARYLMDDSVAGLFHSYGETGLREEEMVFADDQRHSVGGAIDTANTATISNRSPVGSLADLGREMYEAIFQGNLRDRLTSAQAIAHNQGAVLRLRLGLKDPILTRLPWEVLHEDIRPIATGKDVIFSRYQPTLSSLILPEPPTGPIKILMVVAAPSDQENLALKLEAQELRTELQKQSSDRVLDNGLLPKIELDILEHPDRETLTQVLEQNTYHVLHYAGHSNLGSQGGELYLVNQKTGLAEILNGDDLAGLLVNNGIHLAVFNSCRGAESAVSSPTDSKNPRNLAEVLVNRGIPAVLAMAERIPDRVALTLTRLFYYNLKQGYPVDLSLNRARQGLVSTYGSNQLYWALPVLYLHEKYHGYLTAKPTHDDEDVFIPPRPLPKARKNFSDISEPSNGNGHISPWRIPHSDINDDLDPNDEDDFFLEDPQDLSEDDDEFMDYDFEDDDDEFMDYELGDNDEGDAESLVSDIFSELGLGNPGADGVPPGQFSPDDELFPNIAKSETAESPISTRAVDSETVSQTETAPRSGKNTPPSKGSSELNPQMLLTPTKPKKQKPKKRLTLGFGVVSLVAVGLVAGAVSFWRSRPETDPSLPMNSATEEVVTTSESPQEKPNPWETANTPEVAAIAIEHFAQGKLTEGVMAVNALLDRGALQQAKATLEAVPNSRKNTAEINFVSGRLAWQFVQIGNQDYSVSDARRFWEAAVKSEPDSPLYANALAFAYYAEGNLELASDMWLKVVTLLESTESLDHPDILTAYAGLALAMMQSSTKPEPDQQSGLISKAIKQRKMVMKLAPIDFQPESLAKNWMWPESAIADWQKLLTIDNSPATQTPPKVDGSN